MGERFFFTGLVALILFWANSSQACAVQDSNLESAKTLLIKHCLVKKYNPKIGHDCDEVSPDLWICATREIRQKDVAEAFRPECLAEGDSFLDAKNQFEQLCQRTYGSHKDHDCDQREGLWICGSRELKIEDFAEVMPPAPISESRSVTGAELLCFAADFSLKKARNAFGVRCGLDYDSAVHDCDEIESGLFLCANQKISAQIIASFRTSIPPIDPNGIEAREENDRGKKPSLICRADNRLLAFPGAQGFGRYTRGGRGGRILTVTNLNDSGRGSLREALENSRGKRIVVFDVGGTIELSRTINIRHGEVTVAGQTAPFPGITLKNGGLKISSSQVIVRGLKIRPGDKPTREDFKDRDGVAIGSTSMSISNIIVDHNSISWGVDENLSVFGKADYSNMTSEVTISNNIIAEALFNSRHPEGAHSKGVLLSTGAEKITMHKNLLASNYRRNPRINSDQAELINNYVYNASSNLRLTPGGDRLKNNRNFSVFTRLIGNYYHEGDHLIDRAGFLTLSWFNRSRDQIHAHGNLTSDRRPSNQVPEMILFTPNDGRKRPLSLFSFDLNARIFETRVDAPLLAADDVFEEIQSTVGASFPRRDRIDERVIKEVKNDERGGLSLLRAYVHSPTDVGGYIKQTVKTSRNDRDRDGIPDDVERKIGSSINQADAHKISRSGYSFAELYINSIISEEVDCLD